jgi:hypothetical protein
MPRTKSSKKTNGEVTAAPTATPVTSAVTNEASFATPEPARKPTIVANSPTKTMTDGRAKLVPINVEDEIRRLAYLMSERRGFDPGHEAEDWINAEREVRQRYHQQSA